VVAPSAFPGWWWAGGIPAHPEVQAAQIVRQLADGETPRQSAGLPAWTVVAYIFAALFVLQLLFVLATLGISLVTGF